MKIGPMDFNQPSTWRGVIGLAAIGGISVSPALAEQIALLAATLISLIEIFRNEYLAKKPTTTTTTTTATTRINPATPPAEKSEAVPAGFNPDTYGERAPDQSDQLRPLPSHDDVSPTAGFGDR